MKKTSALFGALFVALLLAFIDLLANTAATGVILSGLATPHINPPPQNQADKATDTSPTAFFVQLTWGDDLPHDIDMAVACGSLQNKQLPSTVNYKQTRSGWLVLKQDDQGKPSVMNLEKVESNTEVMKIPPLTRCWINAHLYHTHNGSMPVEGTLLAIQDKDNAHERLISRVPFKLTFPGEEITVIEVTWNERSVILDEVTETFPNTKLARIMTSK